MHWFRRLLGTDAREGGAADVDDPVEAFPADADGEPQDVADPSSVPIPCPSCAVLLDPPPTRSRRCPYCREPIVVRRVDGRTAVFTEQAVAVFEAQRRRELDEARWGAAREQWLLLARSIGVPQDQRARVAAMPISPDAVASAERLYATTAEHAMAAARREKRWGDVGQLARDLAAARYKALGSPIPVPEEILALHRDGMAAVLRSLVPLTKDVELVSAGCCRPCRADSGAVFRASDELKARRLPHDGCPHGLCGCDWWPAVMDPRRRRRRRSATRPAASGAAAATGDVALEDAPAADHPGLEGGPGDHVPPVEERERIAAHDAPVGE